MPILSRDALQMSSVARTSIVGLSRRDLWAIVSLKSRQPSAQTTLDYKLGIQLVPGIGLDCHVSLGIG
jgi:hypothetical protein